MGMLKLIEWKDNSRDTIVYKIDMKKKFVDLSKKEQQIILYGSPDKISFKMKSSR